ncbi:MAG TPA: Si-specific NAD(P)(+) transhydrogenase [Gaiellales bacterium]|nr:Si-specific NAD(P)(+) transhydrogenase [Gaiellales bacterium]
MSSADSTPVNDDAPTAHFDLLAIGGGPAGQKAAIQAAKLGRRAAIVEQQQLGGCSVFSGTIPSKTLREAVLYLTGFMQRSIYGQSHRVKEDITMDDLRTRSADVSLREADVIRDQLTRNRVTIFDGSARFVDADTVAITAADGRKQVVDAGAIVIATGSRPVRPAAIEFDDESILDSDGILNLAHIPQSLVVVGAGVIGIEYASMFAAVGTKVTVIDARRELLPFCDSEIVRALQLSLRDLGVIFRLGETVEAVERHESGALTMLKSGKRIVGETVLYSAGRQGATAGLGLESVGVETDARGQIHVDHLYRTSVEGIYAVGDVVGFPALAATAMEQGRIASLAALGKPTEAMNDSLPIGIYSIPEISFVGKTEEQLTEAGVPYEVGISRYRELARGQILGDHHGMLKLLVSLDDRTLLGVHVLGTGATELVHIGQVAMGNGATVDYLVGTVFNYPTLAEAYKVAALDAQNRLQTLTDVGPLRSAN